MSQNITLLGASYSAVPAVTLPKTGGGTARFDDCSVVTASASDVASGKIFVASDGTITTGTSSGGGGGGGLYPWLGSGAEKVGTVLSKTINLANDTTWSSWNPSTTAKTLIAASTTNDYTGSLNMNDYDFFFITKGFIEPAYVAGTPTTYRPYRIVQYYAYYVYGYPNSNTISQWQNNTVGNVGTSDTVSNMFCLYYYNSSGALASRSGTSCGPLYMSASPNISIANPTDGVSTLSYKLPAFYAKCDSSRFSTTRAGQIDAANTNYNLTVDLYRVPHGNGLMSHWVSEACAALNAP